MILNYQLGGAGKFHGQRIGICICFLNSTKEGELKERLPDVKTRVLPPPTDLDAFFEK
jgi:hypothetical protein